MIKETDPVLNETEQAREIIESIIEDIFSGNDEYYWSLGLGKLKGLRLSTNSNKVDPEINSEFFYGKCGTLSALFTHMLEEKNIPYTNISSEDPDHNGHSYFSIDLFSQPIIVDPSIGQFINGHTHIFVGTREDLKDLVTQQTGVGKKYQIINTRSKNNATETLSRTWGIKGERKYSFKPKE